MTIRHERTGRIEARSAKRRSERSYRMATAALTAMMFLTSVAWSIISPPMSGPDEIPHYNSVSRLVASEGWPLPYEAEIRGDTWQAVAESGAPSGSFPGERPEDLPRALERSTLHTNAAYEPSGRDQMVQHPPAPYVVTATAVGLTGGGDLRWDHASFLMRVMSALYLAAAVPFIIGVVRRITGVRTAGLVGGASLFTVPFLATVGGFVTNDSALVAASSASVYFAVLALRNPRTVAVALPLAGAALGVALLSKGLALLSIPVIGVLALVASWQAGGTALKRLGRPVIAMAIAFAIGGWWWLRNLLVLGTIQPSQLGSRTPRDPAELNYDFGEFFVGFWERFNRLFWGRGAREQIAYPTWLVDAAGIALVVLIVAVLILSRHRLVLLALLAIPTMIIAVTLNNAHGIYVDIGWPDRGVQGRYIYSGIVAYAAVWGLGWHLLHSRVPRAATWVAPAVLVFAGVVTAAGLRWVLVRAHQEDSISEAVAAATELTGVGWPILAIVAALWLLSCAVAIGSLVAAREKQGLLAGAGDHLAEPLDEPATPVHGSR